MPLTGCFSLSCATPGDTRCADEQKALWIIYNAYSEDTTQVRRGGGISALVSCKRQTYTENRRLLLRVSYSIEYLLCDKVPSIHFLKPFRVFVAGDYLPPRTTVNSDRQYLNLESFIKFSVIPWFDNFLTATICITEYLILWYKTCNFSGEWLTPDPKGAFQQETYNSLPFQFTPQTGFFSIPAAPEVQGYCCI